MSKFVEILIKVLKAGLAILMAFYTVWFVDLWSTFIVDSFVDYWAITQNHQFTCALVLVLANVALSIIYYKVLTKKVVRKENEEI